MRHWAVAQIRRRIQVGYSDVLADPGPSWHRTAQLVQVTYVVWAYFAFILLRQAPNWMAEPPDVLLWPVAWMRVVPWELAVLCVLAMFFVGNLAAALAPWRRSFRITAFVGILLAQGLKYSYDKINHSFHLLAFAALLLIWLAPDDRDESSQRSDLEIAWGVQAVILVTYTLAGLQKLWGAYHDFVEDGHTVFSSNSLALHVAKVELRGSGDGPLAQFLLDHPDVTGPLMMAGLLVELTAITVLFRPRAQRVFGLALIGLHVGTGLALNIWFSAQVLVVALWLVGSPFVARRQPAFVTVREIPWIGPGLASALVRSPERDRLTVYSTTSEAGFPGDVRRADVQELGLSPRVRFAVRHRRRDASVLLVGERARVWADIHARAASRWRSLLLLLPRFVLRLVHLRGNRGSSSMA